MLNSNDTVIVQPSEPNDKPNNTKVTGNKTGVDESYCFKKWCIAYDPLNLVNNKIMHKCYFSMVQPNFGVSLHILKVELEVMVRVQVCACCLLLHNYILLVIMCLPLKNTYLKATSTICKVH